MTPTQVTTKEELNKLDEPIRASKWRNLWFFKDGKTSWGGKIWPTEDSARKRAEEQLRENSPMTLHSTNGVITGYLWGDFTHVLQIPIIDKE